ncbi:MAG: accessory factor UbiK family protein [Pseudomonadota bacterium]
MQTDNRLFDDLAKVASGAMHTIGGVRDEVETRVRERFERWANEAGFVTREEFEATKAMAQRARLEQDHLSTQIEALEKRLAAMEQATASRPRRRKDAKDSTTTSSARVNRKADDS